MLYYKYKGVSQPQAHGRKREMTWFTNGSGDVVVVQGSDDDPKAIAKAQAQALQLAEGRGSLNR